ncbi:hypothetical protein HK098_000422, partial [Nowakowskiella sp. JEL0407]
MQGFVNHCRIVHKMEFAGHSEAVRVCGVFVDEAEVPVDHEARRMQRISSLNLNWWDVSSVDSSVPQIPSFVSSSSVGSGNPLKRASDGKPKIKVFEQEIDFETDLSTATQSLQQNEDGNENEEVEEPVSKPGRRVAGKYPRISGRNYSAVVSTSSTEEIETENEKLESEEVYDNTNSVRETETPREFDNDSVEELENEGESLDTLQTDGVPERDEKLDEPRADGDESVEEKESIRRIMGVKGVSETNEASGNGSKVGEMSVEQQIANQPTVLNASKVMLVTGPRVPFWANSNTPINPAATTTQPPISIPTPTEIAKPTESRFYIKKRILVGNVSKFIPVSKREDKKYSYKWMVYVRDAE